MAPKFKKTKESLFSVVKENRSVAQYKEINVKMHLGKESRKVPVLPKTYSLWSCHFLESNDESSQVKPALGGYLYSYGVFMRLGF